MIIFWDLNASPVIMSCIPKGTNTHTEEQKHLSFPLLQAMIASLFQINQPSFVRHLSNFVYNIRGQVKNVDINGGLHERQFHIKDIGLIVSSIKKNSACHC